MRPKELSQLTHPEATNTPRADTTSKQHDDLSRSLLQKDVSPAGPSSRDTHEQHLKKAMDDIKIQEERVNGYLQRLSTDDKAAPALANEMKRFVTDERRFEKLYMQKQGLQEVMNNPALYDVISERNIPQNFDSRLANAHSNYNKAIDRIEGVIQAKKTGELGPDQTFNIDAAMLFVQEKRSKLQAYTQTQ